jgi:hypothetical protein
VYYNLEPDPKQTRRKYEASSKEGLTIVEIALNSAVVSRIRRWQGMAFFTFEGISGGKWTSLFFQPISLF